MCSFCNKKYDPSKAIRFEREGRVSMSYDGYTGLKCGVDENGCMFIIAVGEDESDRYYPKFCPECGQKLKTHGY